jgi:hypothetical protein
MECPPGQWNFTPHTWSAKICTAVNCHQVPQRDSGAGRSGAKWVNISPDVFWGGATSHWYSTSKYIYTFLRRHRPFLFLIKHGIKSIVVNKTIRLPYVAMANTDLRIAIVGAGEFYFLTHSFSFVRDYYFTRGRRDNDDIFI